MFPPRWRKVLRDLWHNKSRTLLVVLSIAVGVFAVGAVAGARAILARDLQSQYDLTADASARIFASGLDENFIDAIRRMPEIAEAQGRSLYLLRIKNESLNSNLLLYGIDNFDDIRVNTIDFISGARTPPWRQLLIERAATELFNVQQGGSLTVELRDGKKRALRIAGTVHDLNAPPPRFANFGSAYVSMETLEWLGFPKTYSEMRIIVKQNGHDRAYIQTVVDKIKDRIEDSSKDSAPETGRRYFGNNIQQNPGRHYADEQIQTMLLILVALGALSLFLSAFLVINTISAVMQQQLKQIGIMKSIGGRGRQIASLYLGMVAIFGALSLLIAVPVGALGARAMTGYIAGLLNFDILTQGTPTDVLLLEIAVGLLIPLLAALVPIINGARMTVREAITSTGLESVGWKVGRFEGWMNKPANLPTFQLATLLPRPLLISLRNTFRKKGRLALTLGTLILATAIFVSVFSVRDSLTGTLQDSLRYWSFDIEVALAQSQSEERALNEVRQVPGVVYAEAWSNDNARRVREDKTESRNIAVIAVPGESKLIQPILIAGRWLQPDDENAIVINADVLADEPDLKVGDVIPLKFGQRKFPFQVVGIAQSTLTGQVRNPRTLYITREGYRNTLGLPRQARTLVVVTEQHDAASQAAIAKEIDAQFRRALMRVDTYETISDRREQIAFQFNILVTFLIIMATLLAFVGGLGLAGTMSMNVLDRTREIGVMRAIGASDRAIRQIVVVEGVLIGWLSWLIGSLFALPISKLLADQVGMAFIRRTLNYEFSSYGLLLWLGIVTVIAGLASFFPAWRASRLTVREVLAYE